MIQSMIDYQHSTFPLHSYSIVKVSESLLRTLFEIWGYSACNYIKLSYSSRRNRQKGRSPCFFIFTNI
jgi:hypothetical protein